MAKNTIPPSDVTGRQKAELEKRLAAEIAKRAKEMAMAAEVEQEEKSEVVDYTNPGDSRPAQTEEPLEVDEDFDPTIEAIVASAETNPEDFDTQSVDTIVEQVTIADRHDAVLVRANVDMEQVTIGVGNHFDFEAGRKYRLPFNAARHLAENGHVDILR